MERFYKAIEDFDWVLDKEPDNIKALLRRADAHEKIGQMKEAHADLQRSVIVDENNKRAKVGFQLVLGAKSGQQLLLY